MSVRKVLNLTYAWLFELIGGTEQWKKDYEPVFNHELHEEFDYVEAPAGGSGLMGGI